MNLNTRHAELPDNIKLPFVEQGSALGVPVIFLHGFTDSWRSFELLLPHLPTSVRAFALTQRGHGEASKPDTGYAPKDFAADVAAFMDYIGLKAAVIVGHSMGSYNAQRFAVDYPQRTLGVVLIGSFVTCRGNRGVTEFYENEITNLTDPVPAEFAREFQASTVARPLPESQLEIFAQESLKLPARLWKAVCKGFIDSDFSGELETVKAPALIVWGDKDTYFPRSDQEVLAQKIAGSKLVIYEGAGHSPHWEEPEKVARDIVNFIETEIERPASSVVR